MQKPKQEELKAKISLEKDILLLVFTESEILEYFLNMIESWA